MSPPCCCKRPPVLPPEPGDERTTPPRPGLVRDPVCRRWVDPATAGGGGAAHEGQMHHFCHEACRSLFLAEPGRYLADVGSTSTRALSAGLCIDRMI